MITCVCYFSLCIVNNIEEINEFATKKIKKIFVLKSKDKINIYLSDSLIPLHGEQWRIKIEFR